jgi:hypothetical protein
VLRGQSAFLARVFAAARIAERLLLRAEKLTLTMRGAPGVVQDGEGILEDLSTVIGEHLSLCVRFWTE